MKKLILFVLYMVVFVIAKAQSPLCNSHLNPAEITEAEWKQKLHPKVYEILRQKGTERAFSGEFHAFKGKGVYHCKGCESPLFSSNHKFDSGTGWPSYFQPIHPKAVETHTDQSHGMIRTEVVCGTCKGHLGHVFRDGPAPTGMRYCINSIALDFTPETDPSQASGFKKN